MPTRQGRSAVEMNAVLSKSRLVVLILAIFASIAGYYGLSDYLSGPSGNCRDTVIASSQLERSLIHHLVRRECGMLYGGPYTVVKLSSEAGFRSLLGDAEVIEIEDDNGNIRPKVIVKDGKLMIGGIRDYMKYHVRNSVFGLQVQISPEE
jgi:hypothetical protein